MACKLPRDHLAEDDEPIEWGNLEAFVPAHERRPKLITAPPWTPCPDCGYFDAAVPECDHCCGCGHLITEIPTDDASVRKFRRGSLAYQIIIRARYVAGVDPMCPPFPPSVPDYAQPLLSSASDA